MPELPGPRLFRVGVTVEMTASVGAPFFHGPMLYSALCEACGRAAADSPFLPDGVVPISVEQGRTRLDAGTRYAFGWDVIAQQPEEAGRITSLLLRGLKAVGERRGNVKLGGCYRLVSATDAYAGRTINLDELSAVTLSPLDSEFVNEASGWLSRQRDVSIRFVTPLRMYRASEDRRPGRAFFDADFFSGGLFVHRVQGRLRRIGLWPHSEGDRRIETFENDLVWFDAPYGPSGRRKRPAGAVGRVILRGLDRQSALAIVLGAHVGVGLNPRLGLGRYRIPGLPGRDTGVQRSSSLLELALSGHALDRFAAEAGLSPGEARRASRAAISGDHGDCHHTRISIPKPDRDAVVSREPRVLSIPNPALRAIQRALSSSLGPAIDVFFEDSSFAYRSGLGRASAAERVREAVRAGYRFALRADFTRMFDNVEHSLVERRLRSVLADDVTADAIMHWIRSGSPWATRGLPTGAPISPLLANLLLDRFDEEITASGALLVRYADDFLVFYRRREDADAVLLKVRQVAETLALELNLRKTETVDLAGSFEFLGYRFERNGSWTAKGGDGVSTVADVGWNYRPRVTPPERPIVVLPGETDDIEESGGPCAVLGPGVVDVDFCDGKLVWKTEKGIERAADVAEVSDLIVVGEASIGPGLLSLVGRDSGLSSMLVIDERCRQVVTLSRADGGEHAGAVCRQADASRDAAWSLSLARRLVWAKLCNYATLADTCADPGHDDGRGARNGEQAEVSNALRTLAVKALNAERSDELLGIEGAGGARWYAHFPHCLPPKAGFPGRVKPGATDPINIMLNIGFTVLHRHACAAIRSAGLVPTIGVYHKPRAGHAALASDLVEPFRHMVDRAVIHTAGLLPARQLHHDDDNGGLAPAATRQFMAVLLRSLALLVRCEGAGAAKSYRSHLNASPTSLRRHLLDRSCPLTVFTHPAAEDRS